MVNRAALVFLVSFPLLARADGRPNFVVIVEDEERFHGRVEGVKIETSRLPR